MYSNAVYPRWRGEHGGQIAEGVDAARFIPAGAGNTLSLPTMRMSPPVYPRWRGEHICAILAIPPYAGLSPLARGTLRNESGKSLIARFIPAGAGNTFKTLLRGRWFTVYPRWRGEHL